jgi:hypothetical protein
MTATYGTNRKGILGMKTFIVYDLDSKMPVAVGEQVSAETARYCASLATGIFPQIFLQKKLVKALKAAAP